MQIYSYGALIICMIILFYVLMRMNTIQEDILTGFWKSNSEFLDKNNISVFSMAISPLKNSTRSVYIVMKDNINNTIINEPNDIIMTKSYLQIPFNVTRIEYTVRFEHAIVSGIDEVIIPQELNMIYEPISGFFTMFVDDIVYIEMYKDNELSDLEVVDAPTDTNPSDDIAYHAS